jgi:hypothetical protein
MSAKSIEVREDVEYKIQGHEPTIEFSTRVGEDHDYVFFRARENGILKFNMFISRASAHELRDFLNEYLDG